MENNRPTFDPSKFDNDEELLEAAKKHVGTGVALDAIREVTYNVGRGEDNEKRVFNNLMNHGWSTRFGSESVQPTIMQDLLRNKAERYFAVNYPSVTEIHFAQRKHTGANDDQYIGYDKERVVVAWVYLEDLNRWAGVASPKPLLVLSFKQPLNKDQIERATGILTSRISDAGWAALVVDGMDKSKVQVFGIDTPHINSMSLDEIEALLDGVRRAREASDPDRGLNS